MTTIDKLFYNFDKSRQNPQNNNAILGMLMHTIVREYENLGVAIMTKNKEKYMIVVDRIEGDRIICYRESEIDTQNMQIDLLLDGVESHVKAGDVLVAREGKFFVDTALTERFQKSIQAQFSKIEKEAIG
jgi:hypothetical protein